MLNIDLKGKKAFIAGIGDDQGYGWAIAKSLAEAGAELGAMGAAEVVDGLETRQVAKDIAKEGIKDVAKGAAEMGAAEVMEDVAEEMEKKSKE